MKVLYITLVTVLIDQITKILVKGISVGGLNIEGMPYGSSKQVIGDFIRLTFIENPGMAFGLDIGPKMFLTLFTIVASLVILYYIYKHRHDTVILRVALAFILAGAIGNLMDRTFYGLIYDYAPLFHGRVVDFIQVDTWDFTIFGRTYSTWPIFNVADISVTVGFLTILFFHNRIFGEDTKEGQLAPVTNDADGSPIEQPDLVEHEINSIPPINDSNGSFIDEPEIVDHEINEVENTEFKESDYDKLNDQDGSSIDKDVNIQPPIDEEISNKGSINEDPEKNGDTRTAGAEEDKNR